MMLYVLHVASLIYVGLCILRLHLESNLTLLLHNVPLVEYSCFWCCTFVVQHILIGIAPITSVLCFCVCEHLSFKLPCWKWVSKYTHKSAKCLFEHFVLLVKFWMLEESNTPELPRRCKHLWCSSIAFLGVLCYSHSLSYVSMCVVKITIAVALTLLFIQ